MKTKWKPYFSKERIIIPITTSRCKLQAITFPFIHYKKNSDYEKDIHSNEHYLSNIENKALNLKFMP